ncbi:MAG: hypothetical protein FWC68_03065, partial [Oscillospiraceae bacterium]|nr:hypothetical protein [Oscillospiraceae bacterium]
VIKNEMLTVIKECKREGNCILIATHLIRDTEEILDSVIFLKRGKLELFEDSKNITSGGETIEKRYLEVFKNV